MPEPAETSPDGFVSAVAEHRRAHPDLAQVSCQIGRTLHHVEVEPGTEDAAAGLLAWARSLDVTSLHVSAQAEIIAVGFTADVGGYMAWIWGRVDRLRGWANGAITVAQMSP
jgi:hypothetical protein